MLDLRTGQESLLAETRSVDDQVEWLDDDRLLYGLSRPGSDATTSDVWVVPADGTGAAAVFIPEAAVTGGGPVIPPKLFNAVARQSAEPYAVRTPAFGLVGMLPVG